MLKRRFLGFAVLAVLVTTPGCIFAVGTDGENSYRRQSLEKRVEALEQRVDALEKE